MTSYKEKIAAVRAVVSDRSNDEIVLVLQHYDGDIKKTIQDFVEDRADDILTEWKHAGPVRSKNTKKRKKNKQKKKQASSQISEDTAVEKTAEPLDNGFEKLSNHASDDIEAKSPQSASVALKLMLIDTKSSHGSAITTMEGTTNLVDTTPSPTEKDSNVNPPTVNGTNLCLEEAGTEKASRQAHYLYHGGSRTRTTSESSNRSVNKKKHKYQQSQLASNDNHTNKVQSSQNQIENHANSLAATNRKSIEKAVKDLQRCSVSFGRYKTLLSDEIQDSYKRIKQTFEDFNHALIDREVELIRRLDDMKTEAFELMAKREAQAQALKRRTDRAASMNQHELSELRNEIKHFVAQRKYDEELGRTSRFVHDREILTKIIPNFGEITGIKNSYTLTPKQRTDSEMSSASNTPASASTPPSAASAPTPSAKEPPRQLAISNPNLPTVPGKASSPSDAVAYSEAPTSAAPATGATSSGAKASASQRLKGKIRKDESKEHEEIANGHIEDWAEATDHLPLPESPVSWASNTPLVTPDEPTKLNDVINARPQRTPRRDRGSKVSTSSDKDREAMPPPNKIPQPKSDRTHQTSQPNTNTADSGRPLSRNRAPNRENYNKERPRGAYRGFRGGYRGRGGHRGGHSNRGEGDGHNHQPFNDRSNDTGNRSWSGARGGRPYDGRSRGGHNRQNNDQKYAKNPVSQKSSGDANSQSTTAKN